ncbi:hypothetical protein CHUAL_005819 [Chamberlinius hualienensis]
MFRRAHLDDSKSSTVYRNGEKPYKEKKKLVAHRNASVKNRDDFKFEMTTIIYLTVSNNNQTLTYSNKINLNTKTPINDTNSLKLKVHDRNKTTNIVEAPKYVEETTGNVNSTKNMIEINKNVSETTAVIGNINKNDYETNKDDKKTTKSEKTTLSVGKRTENAGETTDNVKKITKNVGKKTNYDGKTTENIGKKTNYDGKTTENIGKKTNYDGKTTENIGKTTKNADGTYTIAEETTRKFNPTKNVDKTTKNVEETTNANYNKNVNHTINIIAKTTEVCNQTIEYFNQSNTPVYQISTKDQETSKSMNENSEPVPLTTGTSAKTQQKLRKYDKAVTNTPDINNTIFNTMMNADQRTENFEKVLKLGKLQKPSDEEKIINVKFISKNVSDVKVEVKNFDQVTNSTSENVFNGNESFKKLDETLNNTQNTIENIDKTAKSILKPKNAKLSADINYETYGNVGQVLKKTNKIEKRSQQSRNKTYKNVRSVDTIKVNKLKELIEKENGNNDFRQSLDDVKDFTYQPTTTMKNGEVIESKSENHVGNVDVVKLKIDKAQLSDRIYWKMTLYDVMMNNVKSDDSDVFKNPLNEVSVDQLNGRMDSRSIFNISNIQFTFGKNKVEIDPIETVIKFNRMEHQMNVSIEKLHILQLKVENKTISDVQMSKVIFIDVLVDVDEIESWTNFEEVSVFMLYLPVAKLEKNKITILSNSQLTIGNMTMIFQSDVKLYSVIIPGAVPIKGGDEGTNFGYAQLPSLTFSSGIFGAESITGFPSTRMSLNNLEFDVPADSGIYFERKIVKQKPAAKDEVVAFLNKTILNVIPKVVITNYTSKEQSTSLKDNVKLNEISKSLVEDDTENVISEADVTLGKMKTLGAPSSDEDGPSLREMNAMLSSDPPYVSLATLKADTLLIEKLVIGKTTYRMTTMTNAVIPNVYLAKEQQNYFQFAKIESLPVPAGATFNSTTLTNIPAMMVKIDKTEVMFPFNAFIRFSKVSSPDLKNYVNVDVNVKEMLIIKLKVGSKTYSNVKWKDVKMPNVVTDEINKNISNIHSVVIQDLTFEDGIMNDSSIVNISSTSFTVGPMTFKLNDKGSIFFTNASMIGCSIKVNVTIDNFRIDKLRVGKQVYDGITLSDVKITDAFVDKYYEKKIKFRNVKTPNLYFPTGIMKDTEITNLPLTNFTLGELTMILLPSSTITFNDINCKVLATLTIDNLIIKKLIIGNQVLSNVKLSNVKFKKILINNNDSRRHFDDTILQSLNLPAANFNDRNNTITNLPTSYIKINDASFMTQCDTVISFDNITAVNNLSIFDCTKVGSMTIDKLVIDNLHVCNKPIGSVILTDIKIENPKVDQKLGKVEIPFNIYAKYVNDTCECQPPFVNISIGNISKTIDSSVDVSNKTSKITTPPQYIFQKGQPVYTAGPLDLGRVEKSVGSDLYLSDTNETQSKQLNGSQMQSDIINVRDLRIDESDDLIGETIILNNYTVYKLIIGKEEHLFKNLGRVMFVDVIIDKKDSDRTYITEPVFTPELHFPNSEPTDFYLRGLKQRADAGKTKIKELHLPELNICRGNLHDSFIDNLPTDTFQLQPGPNEPFYNVTVKHKSIITFIDPDHKGPNMVGESINVKNLTIGALTIGGTTYYDKILLNATIPKVLVDKKYQGKTTFDHIELSSLNLSYGDLDVPYGGNFEYGSITNIPQVNISMGGIDLIYIPKDGSIKWGQKGFENMWTVPDTIKGYEGYTTEKSDWVPGVTGGQKPGLGPNEMYVDVNVGRVIIKGERLPNGTKMDDTVMYDVVFHDVIVPKGDYGEIYINCLEFDNWKLPNYIKDNTIDKLPFIKIDVDDFHAKSSEVTSATFDKKVKEKNAEPCIPTVTYGKNGHGSLFVNINWPCPTTQDTFYEEFCPCADDYGADEGELGGHVHIKCLNKSLIKYPKPIKHNCPSESTTDCTQPTTTRYVNQFSCRTQIVCITMTPCVITTTPCFITSTCTTTASTTTPCLAVTKLCETSPICPTTIDNCPTSPTPCPGITCFDRRLFKLPINYKGKIITKRKVKLTCFMDPVG